MDAIFKRLYEDNISGKLSDERFQKLSADYEKEEQDLKEMCIRDRLYRYMDADFVKEHPYIYLSVDGEDMIFQITALFVTDIGFDYIAPDPTGDDLTSFFETIARKNWLDFDGVTFSEEDTVLTLSTCCRKYDKANSGNQRLVVMAKLLPEGATAQEFSVSLVDSPEMP